MSKNIEHLQHIKSNVVIEGKPKLPTAEVLVDGELAVNYAEGYETISLRNSNSGITTFSSDDYYTKNKLGSGFTGVNSANTVTSVIEENEEIISSALNDLEGRKLDASAYTEGMTDYYLKSETSGVTELDAAFSGKVDVTWVEDKIGSAFTGANSGVTITEYIEENEETTAAALNDLNERKMDASAYTPTDLTNYYTKSETSGATEIQTALNSKVDATAFTNHTGSSVHMTTTEKTNLDSLATNIAAISGITATKVNNWDDANTKKHSHSNKTALDSITGNVGTMAYEDKTSYSSATEVNTALSNKADKTAVDDLSGQSETIAAALNNLNTRLSENSSTVANKADISDVEELEETLTAAVTDINTRMAENTALAELAEQLRLLTERVKALEDAAQTT